MKQIAYLTMVFLPATFAAVRFKFSSFHLIAFLLHLFYQSIFGMNVGEINPGTNGTVPQYLAVALPLTVFTAWIIIAFQSKYIFPRGTGFLMRLAWPIFLIRAMISKKKTAPAEKLEYPEPAF